MSQRSHEQTGASTAGMLPDTVSIALLAIVCATVVFFGERLGYDLSVLLALSGSGILAAVGVRVAIRETTWAIVAGVTMLWTAAFAFTGGTVRLVVQQGTVQPIAVAITLVVAGAALLGPYGIVTNTIQTYGQGAGRAVIERYLTGIVAFLVLAGLYAAAVGTQLIDFAVVSETTPGIANVILLLDGLGIRVAIAGVVYAIALLVLSRLSDSLPVEIFVTADNLDHVDEIRDYVTTACYYGWRLLFGYLVLAAVAGLTVAGPDDLQGTEGEMLAFLQSVTVPIVSVVARPALVGTVAVSTAICLLVLLTLRTIRGAVSISGAAVVQAVVPPLVLISVVGVVSTRFDDLIPIDQAEPLIVEVADPGSLVYQLLTDWPSLLVLLVCLLALSLSALVLSFPVMIAGITPADRSLTGVVSGVTALTAFVLVAIWTREPVWVLILGVGLTALVWELGEYTVVATGELQSRTPAKQLPAGFATIVSVHAIVTVCVTIIAGGLMLGLVSIATGATLPLTVALLTVFITVGGLSALILLLTG